jgi:hypothetical protein
VGGDQRGAVRSRVGQRRLEAALEVDEGSESDGDRMRGAGRIRIVVGQFDAGKHEEVVQRSGARPSASIALRYAAKFSASTIVPGRTGSPVNGSRARTTWSVMQTERTSPGVEMESISTRSGEWPRPCIFRRQTSNLEPMESSDRDTGGIDLRGQPPSAEALKALTDSELEARLTVAAAAPGNRLTLILGELLSERRERTSDTAALHGA